MPREARHDKAYFAFLGFFSLVGMAATDSKERSSQHASLIQAYADYGDDNAIITAGRAFLTGQGVP